MKRFFQIVLAFSLVGCQIEDENSPTSEEAFIKYFGELTSYEASDIEIVYDATGTIAEGLIVLGTQLSENGDKDFFVLRTDLDGNLIGSNSFGVSDTLDFDGDGNPDDWTGDDIPDRFRGEESAGQIQYIADFGDGSSGFAFVGSSSITINALGISDWQFMTFGLLNEDLTIRTIAGDSLISVGEATDDATPVLLDYIGNDIIQLSSGNFLVAGARQVAQPGNLVDFNKYFLSFTRNGDLLLEIDVGRDGSDDVAVRAFEKENGNLVFIGHNNAQSQRGENLGFTGTNVSYLETDRNGTEVNALSYGIDDSRDASDLTRYDDFVSDVVQTPVGFSVVGTSETSGNEQFAFLMNLASNGQYLHSSAHHFSVYNEGDEAKESLGLGITQALDNNLILLGQYTSFNANGLSRGGEG
ncbi:MAG: hypothetical protein HRT61_07320, partial [Ekhidna sp.]|nr:hypothetical protein [Ekhidna sp.]